MGYARAGFEVVGVDIKPQPNYPFRFLRCDARGMAEMCAARQERGERNFFLGAIDAIHASPPCPRYSAVTAVSGSRGDHPDLIGEVRAELEAAGLPYVIENVEGAPLRSPVRLCGTAFPELRVIRHRLFECSFPLMVPPCGEHPLLYVPDKRRPHQGEQDEMVAPVSVTGGGNCSKAAAADAMGIDWMTKAELNDAIPPAYTQHIGSYLMAEVMARV